MSPARRSVNPQQEALDLGLPEPAPAKTKPAKAEAAQGEPAESTAVEPTRAQRGKKATLLLSDEQLRTTAEPVSYTHLVRKARKRRYNGL